MSGPELPPNQATGRLDLPHSSNLPIDSDVDGVIVGGDVGDGDAEGGDVEGGDPGGGDPGPALSRPLHLHWRYIGIVILGGTAGTAAREALSLLIPPLGVLPIAIFIINIVGAFALGVLLETLIRRGPDGGHRRILRLLLGTGFMGGFTTYSTLATGTAQLFTTGHPLAAVGYALATVIVGAVATAGGIVMMSRLHHRAIRRSGRVAS